MQLIDDPTAWLCIGGSLFPGTMNVAAGGRPRPESVAPGARIGHSLLRARACGLQVPPALLQLFESPRAHRSTLASFLIVP